MINKVETSNYGGNLISTVLLIMQILVILTMEINDRLVTIKVYKFSSSSTLYIVHCKNT